MQSFPIPPNFPQHDWSSDPVLPDFPVLTTKLQGGQTSDLRVSIIQNGGEFTCFWNHMSLASFQVFLNFWTQMGTWGRFTLPADFWLPSCPTPRIAIYTALSPTGIWRFKEKPKWGDFGGTLLDRPTLTVTFLGAID